MAKGMSPNEKRALRERVQAEGDWDAFKEKREQYRAAGVSNNELWPRTAEHFPAKNPKEPKNILADLPPLPPEELKKLRAKEEKPKETTELIPRDRFQMDTAPSPQVISWVARNLVVLDVRPEECVSPEAWGLLLWVREGGTNESEFWRSIYPKLLPSRTQLDAQDRFKDDGRRLLTLIDEVEAMSRELQDDSLGVDSEVEEVAAGV